MKAIIVLSGGMDSTTLLYWALSKKHIVRCISFNYGQRHGKELQYAKNICKSLVVPHLTVDLSCIKEVISNSCLTGNVEVPEGHYKQENMKLTVVPNRNMIMLSIAIGYAENLNYDCVMYGAHAGDHYIYPDCRPEFKEYLDKASRSGTFSKIKLITPFIHKSKGEIAKIGLSLGIDYDKTWTCYKGEEKPCGKCGSCNERIEALNYAHKNTK